MTNPYRNISRKTFVTVCLQCNNICIYGSTDNDCCNKIENLKLYKVFNDETEAKNYIKGIEF